MWRFELSRVTFIYIDFSRTQIKCDHRHCLSKMLETKLDHSQATTERSLYTWRVGSIAWWLVGHALHWWTFRERRFPYRENPMRNCTSVNNQQLESVRTASWCAQSGRTREPSWRSWQTTLPGDADDEKKVWTWAGGCCWPWRALCRCCPALWWGRGRSRETLTSREFRRWTSYFFFSRERPKGLLSMYYGITFSTVGRYCSLMFRRTP